MSFYIIKCHGSEFVLDCEGGGSQHGAKVIPWEHHGNDNQLWYDDHSTGTIKSKAGHLCMDIENNHLVVKEYQHGDHNQQWFRDGHFIRNKEDHNKVLEIENSHERGGRVGEGHFHGGENQMWVFEEVEGHERKFYIVSERHGKVVEVEGGDTNPGAKVCLRHKGPHHSDHQLFTTNTSGHIVSCLHHMAFTNTGKGHDLTMHPPSGDHRSTWKAEGNKIMNGAGECLDIKGDRDEEGEELCSHDYEGHANQHWRIEDI